MKSDGSKKYLYIIIFLIVLCVGTSIVRKIYEMGPKLDTVSAFDNKRVTVAVVDGYIFEERARAILPKAKIEVFETREDAYQALLGGRVDGVVDDEALIRARLRSQDKLVLVDGYLEPSDYSFIFPIDEKGKKICDEYSEYIDKLEASGELAALDEKWFGDDTDNKVSESYLELPDTNGSLTIAYEDKTIPFTYKSRNQLVGYDVDIAIGFCKEYGYKPNFVETTFTDMLTGVSKGDYDAGCGSITVSEERSKSMLFGSPDYKGGISICTLKKVDKGGKGFLYGIKDNFHDAFVEGNRFKIFFGGILATILLVLGGILVGTPSGFIMFILSRKATFLMRGLTKLFAWIIHGVPAIMMIMSLYYSYYMNLFYGGFIAASICFVFVFGEEVYRILNHWSLKIDDGQFERKYRVEAITAGEFFRGLFSKNSDELLYEYREAVVRLIKMTSVVGYVSVQDMTKVVDTIRLESYELALPLFLTTIVYFVIIAIFSKLVSVLIGRRLAKISLSEEFEMEYDELVDGLETETDEDE